MDRAGENEPSALDNLELVRIDTLKPHPRNYNVHPDDELDQLIASIKAHGLYRPVVTARDGTILAGHGITQALLKMGSEYVKIKRKDYDPDDSRALMLLVGDNEIGRMAERDDRALSELIRDIKDTSTDLSGTGYDEMMLANLVFVTRSASEIGDKQAAAAWVGMPAYEEESARLKATVFFPSEEDRTNFGNLIGVDMTKIANEGLAGTFWWPKRVINDLKSVVFTDREVDEPAPSAPLTIVPEDHHES
jgi:hypothetical protein